MRCFLVRDPRSHLIHELWFAHCCGDTFGGWFATRGQVPDPVGENGVSSDAGVGSGDGSEFRGRGLGSWPFGAEVDIDCLQ